MCYYIGIEDLAANALILLLQMQTKGVHRSFISYKDIERYGSMVLHVLNKKGEKAVLILSRESTNELYRNYSDYFEETMQNGCKGIALKKEKTMDDLIEAFRGYLPLPLLLAFVDQDSVKALEESA
jgi:hypothetical protein